MIALGSAFCLALVIKWCNQNLYWLFQPVQTLQVNNWSSWQRVCAWVLNLSSFITTLYTPVRKQLKDFYKQFVSNYYAYWRQVREIGSENSLRWRIDVAKKIIVLTQFTVSFHLSGCMIKQWLQLRFVLRRARQWDNINKLASKLNANTFNKIDHLLVWWNEERSSRCTSKSTRNDLA